MIERMFVHLRVLCVCLLAIALVWPARVRAYAVLSHEAIIDAAWETHIKPLLLKKFPQATEEDMSRAQAYAYGGAIIQDMGYYPYGKPFFSDLTHYIRSGDFIQALLRDSKDINEFAFAIGALAHYAADNDGHRLGINRAVPVLYPGLRKKFGDSVSFEEDRLAHVKTEFGFDVLEIARERYAPDSYHDFIGFEVSRPAGASVSGDLWTRTASCTDQRGQGPQFVPPRCQQIHSESDSHRLAPQERRDQG